MKKNKNSISNSEVEIMRVVSTNGEVTSKFIIDSLCDAKNWKESTVKTFINRLLEKGFLKKRVEGKRYYYSTDFNVDKRCENEIKEELKRICNTKIGGVLENVLIDAEISKNSIKKMIEILEKKYENAPYIVKCNCIKGQCKCENDDCENK